MTLLRLAFLILSLSLLPSCMPDAEWHEESGYRWREVRPQPSGIGAFLGLGREGFRRLTDTGIDFTNRLDPELGLSFEHLLDGSGVAIGDIDGDGRQDVYFARLQGPNVLYRNLGDFKFEDVTEEAGVAAAELFSSGAVFVDVDGDGDQDLLVVALLGSNVLSQNDGSGRFTDVTREAGLENPLSGMTMTLADVKATVIWTCTWPTTRWRVRPTCCSSTRGQRSS